MFLRYLLRVLIATLLVLGPMPLTAHADMAPAQNASEADSRKILLMPLTFGGDIEAHNRTMFGAALREGLARSALKLGLPNKGQIKAGLGCDVPECFDALGQPSSTTHMVRARIDHDDRIYDIEIEAIDLRSGTLDASSRETCEICGTQEVSTQLADQAAAVGEKLVEIMERRPSIEVVSHPGGARVLLDGKAVGTTPYRAAVTPGQHVVQVQLSGHVAQKRTTKAVEGIHEAIHFSLKPVPQDPREQRRLRNLRIWGGLTLAAGLGLAGAGIPLIVLDDQQNTLQCAGENVDSDGTCRWTYDTMDIGLGLTISGAALSTLGVALLAAWGARRKHAVPSNARLSPRGTGFALRF